MACSPREHAISLLMAGWQITARSVALPSAKSVSDLPSLG